MNIEMGGNQKVMGVGANDHARASSSLLLSSAYGCEFSTRWSSDFSRLSPSSSGSASLCSGLEDIVRVSLQSQLSKSEKV